VLKKSTLLKSGNIGNVGNVTHFPRVFRGFSLESNIANDCQRGNVTPAQLPPAQEQGKWATLATSLDWPDASDVWLGSYEPAIRRE
jgi:hypothetical protein